MDTDKKIITYSGLNKLRQSHKQKSIVLTMGTYDVLHLGHLIHFNFCKKQGDILVVGLGNDLTVSKVKGSNRPINNELSRARLIAGLKVVDYVVISEENDPFDLKLLSETLKPDIFVIPAGDSQLKVRKEFMENLGAKVVICKRVPPRSVKGPISSSKIIDALYSDQ